MDEYVTVTSSVLEVGDCFERNVILFNEIRLSQKVKKKVSTLDIPFNRCIRNDKLEILEKSDSKNQYF